MLTGWLLIVIRTLADQKVGKYPVKTLLIRYKSFLKTFILLVNLKFILSVNLFSIIKTMPNGKRHSTMPLTAYDRMKITNIIFFLHSLKQRRSPESVYS